MLRSRKCPRCGVTRAASAFYRDRTTKSGLVCLCKDCGRAYQKEYRAKNKEQLTGYLAEYYQANKENLLAANKAWRALHPEDMRRYRNKYMACTPSARLANRLRGRVRSALKAAGVGKKERTLALIGCSPKFLKDHLESLWTVGMTWDNNTSFGWHIDHIVPIASFDLTNKEERLACFNWNNLQPLWWRPNMGKGRKILTEEEMKLCRQALP